MAELALLLAPAGREAEVERLPLLKPANQPPKLASGSYQDLTAHPLAGLPVQLRLEAVDAIGQRGQSGPLEIVLPAREFRHPLARAIIEERRKLVASPDASMEVAGRLAALGDTRAAQELPVAVPLSLRIAASRLAMNEKETRPASARSSTSCGSWRCSSRTARSPWRSGGCATCSRSCGGRSRRGRRTRSSERLMEELQQAMDEFLEELTRQALQQGQQVQPQEMQRPQDGHGRPPRAAGDARPGARADAERRPRRGARHAGAVAKMLENLRAGMQRAQPSPGEQNLSDLQKMIQLQQQLLERSFQMDRRPAAGPATAGAATTGPAADGASKGSRARTRWASPPPSRKRCGVRWAS